MKIPIAPIFCLLFGCDLLSQPTITSFTPSIAGNHPQVIISGTNFTEATEVSFGGSPAWFFLVNSSTKITAGVGDGSSGEVSVTTPSGTANIPGFMYASPVITSFTPTSGPQGTIVTIKGINFTGSHLVRFGEVAASSFAVLSDSTISAVVGPGTSGYVTVSSFSGSANLPGFTYTGPVINSFNPIFADPGSTINIRGRNFTGTTTISFGGEPATSFTVINDSTIDATNGVRNSGLISITSPNGTGSKAGFLMLPKITSVNPSSGPPGTTVTITGLNFHPEQALDVIRFGPIRAPIISFSTTELVVSVPYGADYGPISVMPIPLFTFNSQPFIPTFPGGGGAFDTSSFVAEPLFGGTAHHPILMDLNFELGYIEPALVDIIAVTNSNKFVVYKNISANGVPSFAAPLEVQTPGVPYMVASEDLEFNQFREVVVSNPTLNTITVFRNSSMITFPSISFTAGTSLPTGLTPKGIAIRDIDYDGRPDIVVANYGSNTVSIIRNTTSYSTGGLTFASKVDFATGTNPQPVSLADFDGDGKVDIVTGNYGADDVSILRNTSTVGALSFAPKVDITTGVTATRYIYSGDVDMDGKPDLITPGPLGVLVFRNTSTIGNISFETPVNFLGSATNGISMSDLNGDGKPDIVISNASAYSIFSNLSTPGNISLGSRKDYPVTSAGSGIVCGDMNVDGKPDIITLSLNGFYQNKMGEPFILQLCPPAASTTLHSDVQGTVYQWQHHLGNGFTNIGDDGYQSGTNSVDLQFNNIPSSWDGRHFRCMVDGNPSKSFKLKFINKWTGTAGNLWENPANWSCGVVPDNNTNVVIGAGNVVMLTSDVTIKTLTLEPGAQLTVTPPYILTITN